MKKILLVCNAGMSTSMLVQRMEQAALEKGIEVTITAVGFHQAETCMFEWDVVMLGPQVRHQLASLKKKADGQLPIEVIDMRDYGLMNGYAVLTKALELIENKK